MDDIKMGLTEIDCEVVVGTGFGSCPMAADRTARETQQIALCTDFVSLCDI
jgi:hypothetical protein